MIENGGPDNDVVRAYFAPAVSNLSHQANPAQMMLAQESAQAQAAATCLILACSRSLQDTQLAEWATRAFFMYGGEPRLVFPAMQGQGMPNQGQPRGPFSSPSFHPHLVSTPHPGVFQSPGATGGFFSPGAPQPGGGPAVVGGGQPPLPPDVQFSSKHNGLYLYFSRLVRPLWTAAVVKMQNNNKEPLESTVNR